MLGGQRDFPVVEQLVSVGMLTVALTLFTFCTLCSARAAMSKAVLRFD
jgi:hypothetical protein